MLKSFRLKAITLLEMLIVMSISAGGFFGIVESMRQISYTRLATNGAKAVVNLVRTTKHQSMLLRLLPDESWVYGMGLKFYKTSTAGNIYWVVERVKYLDRSGIVGSGSLYKKYPVNTAPRLVDIVPLAKNGTNVLTEKVILEPRIKLYFFTGGLGNVRVLNIENTSAVYIIFESLTGMVHFYRQNGTQSTLSTLDEDGVMVLFAPSRSVLFVGKDGDIYLAPAQAFHNLRVPR